MVVVAGAVVDTLGAVVVVELVEEVLDEVDLPESPPVASKMMIAIMIMATTAPTIHHHLRLSPASSSPVPPPWGPPGAPPPGAPERGGPPVATGTATVGSPLAKLSGPPTGTMGTVGSGLPAPGDMLMDKHASG